MKNEIELAPYGNLLVYKKGYTADFVKDAIEKNNLSGLRIFDHLDRLNSLDFLVDYNFLQRLDISCIDDQDYSFLKNLTKLKHLGIGISVKENNIIDLSNQQNLESLGIQWRKGKILGLEKCQKITSLTLVDFKESNLLAIPHLKQLNNLNIKTASIKTLNGIERFLDLKMLLLGNCRKLESINDIVALKDISSLHIETCIQIKDFSALRELKNLERLAIVDCKGINSIKFVESLPFLDKLSLLGNTDVLDGDLKSALKVLNVVYSPHRHYNIKIENKENDDLIKANLKKIKDSFNK